MKFFTTSKISENMHETPEGFLVCIGVPIARTGEMTYGEGETPLETGDDGKVLVARDEEEVFRPETMASFEGKAVTILHPEEFVSPENWGRLAKGILQNVRRGENVQSDDLIADLLITDKLAITLVKNGLREVSCGYEAEYRQIGKGRGVQTNIIGNHLALVDQGRAGSSYAIHDHKGKGALTMKLKQKIQAIFAKAQDEALALTTDEAEEGKKDEKKEAAAKDEVPPPKKEEKSKDAAAYDELVQAVKDLGAKVEGMMKPKDASSQPSESEPAKVDAKDDESPAEKSMEDRMKALEMAVSKLLEGKAADADEEESEDAYGEEEEESEDAAGDEPTMTGDAASRVEILAPGMKASGKDFKAKAIQAAYASKDGKKCIEMLTGGKAPTFDSAEKVDTLFIAASELLKAARTSELAGTKRTRDSDLGGDGTLAAVMTAEKMNEINAKHYGPKH